MTAYAARKLEAGPAPEGWCPTDLVHALAQLPDCVSLDLDASRGERTTLELLSQAYGLEGRLGLHDRTGQMRWRFEGAAPAAGAPGGHRTMGELVDSLWPPEVESAAGAGDDTCLSGHTIALLTNSPSHYRMPLFNGLGERVARAGATMRVFFMGSNSAAQPWLSSEGAPRFDHEFVTSAEVPSWVPLSAERDRRNPTRLPKRLGRRLRAFGPSIMLSGGFGFAGVTAHLYAARHRLPFGVWSGETASQASQHSYPGPRAYQRRWLVRRADFGVAYGSVAAHYLRGLSPDLPIVVGRNTSVIEVMERSSPDRGTPLELLSVADLSVPGKGLEVVVDALHHVEPDACRLRVVGRQPPDGPLARAAARDSRTQFLGPLSHSEVRAAMESSDAFVFPSRIDVFGLALVEAMAAGLPSIATSVPGAVADLVSPGQNGLVAGATDPHSWADAIMAMVESPELRASLGAAAQTTVRRRWTMAHAVEGMMAGFRLGALQAGGAMS